MSNTPPVTTDITIKLASEKPDALAAALTAIQQYLDISTDGPALTVKVRGVGDHTATAERIKDILSTRNGVDAEVSANLKERVMPDSDAPSWSDSPMGKLYGNLS